MFSRKGFTLLEISLASAVLLIVLGGSMMAFFGVRKTQGTAVITNMLKVSGQRAMRTMYMELSQARKLLASSSLDPAAKDLGREYFTLFERPATPAAIPAGNMRFPRIDANGGFGLPGPNSGELEEATVGNTLVFVAADKTLELKTNLVSYTYGSPLNVKFLSSQPYLINTYRFIAYYLVDIPLKSNEQAVAISASDKRTHTMQLVRWESKPYIELGDFNTLKNKLVGNPVAAVSVWNDLKNNHGVVGMWDVGAATPATSLFILAATGAPLAVNPPVIQRRSQKLIADAALDGYALDMVAFNTNLGSEYRFLDLNVPTYGPKDSGNSHYPWGFETAITGPSGARSVLVRLTLAARHYGNKHLFGQAQQEVIKVFDM